MFLILVGVILVFVSFFVGQFVGERYISFARAASLFTGVALAGTGFFNGAFFYAEPGFKYHVRTILGEEKMVSDTGYNMHLFGRYNAWKNAMSVQAVQNGLNEITVETEGATTSASLPPKSLVFLDQVDADVSATARFELPSDEEQFLRLARQYRTPENLLRTELIPAFLETLGATAALMSAEDYFQGGQTEFNSEFQRQMEDGIYLVRRIEQTVAVEGARPGTANATLGEDQEDYGDATKTIFVVEKRLGEDGQPIRKAQSFAQFGILVTSARVTDVAPNQSFRERMALRQQAAADRSIAREQRIQEEEQRLLAIARGEREVAERQAQAKVDQIQRTTDAETEKQLGLTAASLRLEQAEIDRQTASIRLEQARIDAEARQVAADAEAYEKRAILEADNALQAKLDAYVAVQKFWANAFARRQVPQQIFGASASGGGSDSDVQDFLDILTVRAAQDLSLNPSIGQGN